MMEIMINAFRRDYDERAMRYIMEQRDSTDLELITQRKRAILGAASRSLIRTTQWVKYTNYFEITSRLHPELIPIICATSLIDQFMYEYIIQVMEGIKLLNNGQLWESFNGHTIPNRIYTDYYDFLMNCINDLLAANDLFDDNRINDVAGINDDTDFDAAVAESLRTYAEETNKRNDAITEIVSNDKVHIKEVIKSNAETDVESNAETDHDCPICMESMDGNIIYKCSNCNNSLCENCFKECYLRSSRCPCCMKENPWEVEKIIFS